MTPSAVIAALSALAQDHRLRLYRLLVQAGPEGMAAGALARALNVPPSSLTFHLNMLRDAELVEQRRDGRSLIYSAAYDRMNGLIDYLTENCCAGAGCATAEEGQSQ